MNRPALLGVLTLSTACSPQAPYSLSLSVSSRTNAQQVEVSYRVTEGATPGEAGDVVEQKSVVGSGESVVTASQTSGTLTVTRNIQQLRDYNVVGETSADLPLVPGEQQEWSDVPVGILERPPHLEQLPRPGPWSTPPPPPRWKSSGTPTTTCSPPPGTSAWRRMSSSFASR